MESGGLPPEKFLRTTPSRTSENALLEHRVKVAIINDLCAQKENRSVVMKRIQPKHNNIKCRIFLFTKPGSSINSKLRYSLTTLNPQLLTRSPHVFSLSSHSDPVH